MVRHSYFALEGNKFFDYWLEGTGAYSVCETVQFLYLLSLCIHDFISFVFDVLSPHVLARDLSSTFRTIRFERLSTKLKKERRDLGDPSRKIMGFAFPRKDTLQVGVLTQQARNRLSLVFARPCHTSGDDCCKISYVSEPHRGHHFPKKVIKDGWSRSELLSHLEGSPWIHTELPPFGVFFLNHHPYVK